MPEKAIHKIHKAPPLTERVFVGIGRATAEVAHKQEQGILWVINKQIVPHLSVENQKKAKLNKTRIELWAKRAGIGLTATEIIAGTIASGVLLKKLKNHLVASKKPTVEIPNFDIPPQVSTAIPEMPVPTVAEEVKDLITRPVKKTVEAVKNIVQTAKLKETVRPFMMETTPTSMSVTPSISTKAFYARGDATDFVSTEYHYLFSGSDQRDHSFPKSQTSDIQTFLKQFPPPPLIHMNQQGAVGNALHLAEGTFGYTRTNRPFWHSTTLMPGVAGYDTFVSSLERNSPVITASLLQDRPILASHQQYAEQIATLLNETKKYPWKYVGHGFDNAKDLSTAAKNYLRNLPTQEIDILTNPPNPYHLWHPDQRQLRERALPTLAALLDRFIAKEYDKKPYSRLFIPSPSYGYVSEGHEPMYDAMVMQAFYPLLMPLVRVAHGMEERVPYKIMLPGFSTSPILERSIRFFQPQERQVVNNYELASEVIYPNMLTARGEKLLDILHTLKGVDPLHIINMWRDKVFHGEIPTK
jgi:hypothetical protein